MLIDIRRLPWIADPYIAHRPCSIIASDYVVRQHALLLLVLVVQYEDAESRLLALTPALLLSLNDVLLQLAHRVFKCGASIVDFIDNENIFANQIGHLEGRKVQPLRSGDFCAWDLDLRIGGAEGFVKGEADGLDGDIGVARFFEERSTPYELIPRHLVTISGARCQVAFRREIYRSMRAGT